MLLHFSISCFFQQPYFKRWALYNRIIRLLIDAKLIKINIRVHRSGGYVQQKTRSMMTKPSISLVLTFFTIFASASLLEAAESNQNSGNIYYLVHDVNNDGEPPNVQYGIFEEENDRYQIVKKGAIAPGQKLPSNCFICVDEDSDFTISLYHPRVMSTEGKAQVKDFIKQEWKTFEKGALFNQGDEIKTSPGSVCELQIGKSAIKVYANTHLILTSMNADEVRIHLMYGKILSVVNGLGDGATFGILTPQANFLAKGTSFLVDSIGPRLSVHEGKLEETILSSGQKFEVSSGKGNVMSPEGGIKQMDLLKDSPDSAEAADFKKRAEQDLAHPESKKWIHPEEIYISGPSQDILANYLDPSLNKGTEHAVITTTTTVTHGVVEARMMFHGKQVGDLKPVKAGETAIADFVCAGGVRVQPTGLAVKKSAELSQSQYSPSKIPDQPPSNS